MLEKHCTLGKFNIEIYNGVDLLKKIVANDKTILSKKDLEVIVLGMGEKNSLSEIKTIWNKHHGA